MLIQDPRTIRWLPAHQNISGAGTKRRCAKTVARILEDQALLLDKGLGKFTKDVWEIVEQAIVEVCTPDSDATIRAA